MKTTKKEAWKIYRYMKDPRFQELNKVCEEIANRNRKVLEDFDFQQYSTWELDWALEDCLHLVNSATQYRKNWAYAALELQKALMYKHEHPVKATYAYLRYRVKYLITNRHVEKALKKANKIAYRQAKMAECA